jgi:ATP-dependent exoDNAse (exonuclease V) alpha subunit
VEAFEGTGGSVVPRVRFSNGATQKITHTDFQVRSGAEFAVRRQIPLQLGYALSIHRCQGMTLDRVEMDLRSVSYYAKLCCIFESSTPCTCLKPSLRAWCTGI